MLLALATIFGLGLLHGVGPDHCLAIGALSARGGLREAVGVSLRFGLGHAAVLAVSAALVSLAGFAVPASWERALELVGGVSLLALGAWTVTSSRALVLHRHAHSHGPGSSHQHAHVHLTDPSHHEGPAHVHASSNTVAAVAGAVFGLSGVRGMLLLLPMAVQQRGALLALGVLLFGLGVVLSMLAVGWLTASVASRARQAERFLHLGVGVASVLVGAFWVVDHL